MSTFALVVDGVAVEYPLTKTDIARRHPQVSFPRGDYDNQIAVYLGYTEVGRTEPPTADTGFTTERDGCRLESGVWVQAWRIRAMNEAELIRQREQWKEQRADAVSRIVVTTEAGNAFDGDEVSQGRMARAILGLQAAGAGATVGWVLANNTVIQVTALELIEALTRAGSAQSTLWVKQDQSGSAA